MQTNKGEKKSKKQTFFQQFYGVFSFLNVYSVTRVVLYTLLQDVFQLPSLWGSNCARCNNVAVFAQGIIMIALGTLE